MPLKKILITGSKGYIGVNLCAFLKTKRVEVIQCDLPNYDITKIERLPRIYNTDAIIHLAAISGVENCEKDPISAINTNILGSYRIMLLALENKIPIVIISSQAVKYHTFYGFTKKTVEQLALKLFDIGLKGVILRPSNVYGGLSFFEKKNTVIANFIKRYKQGKPLIIHGDGKQHRNFLHVNDLCKAIWLSLKIIKEQIEQILDPLEVVTPDTFSINQIADFFPKARKIYDYKANVGSRSVIFDSPRLNSIFPDFVFSKRLEKWIKQKL